MDEYASNSNDNRPVARCHTKRGMCFEKIVGRNPKITQLEDLSNIELAIVDDDPQYNGAIDAMVE